MSTTETPFEQADRLMLAHKTRHGFHAYDVPSVMSTVSQGGKHWLELRYGDREEEQLVIRFWPNGEVECVS